MELGEEYRRPTTKWVKGELTDRIDSDSIDPRGMIAAEAGLSPFDQLQWFQRVATHWDGTLVPFVAHAWNAGSHCWLFLVHEPKRLVALSNWYAMAFRPVFTGGADRQLLAALARRLAKSASVPATMVLSPVPTADGTADLIVDAFGGNGWLALRESVSMSWTADVAGQSFADYWQARPGELRNTHRRRSKKANVAVEIHTCFEDSVWDDYVSVYEHSWKPAEGSFAFLRDMAIHDAASGAMRLGIARIEGQPVAAQLWTVFGGVAYIHKLAHHRDFEAFSPGTILSHDMFRHVIDEDQVKRIDFGTGNDGYKADWMDHCAPLETLTLHKRGTAASMAGLVRARLSKLAAPFRTA